MSNKIVWGLFCGYFALAVGAVVSQWWNILPKSDIVAASAESESSTTAVAPTRIATEASSKDAQQFTGSLEIAPLSTRLEPASQLGYVPIEDAKANLGQHVADSTYAWKVKIDAQPSPELPVQMPGAWGIFVVWLCAFVGFILISKVGKKRSQFWASVFLACTLLTLVPNEWWRALGLLVALAVAIGWLHFAFLKHVHTQGVLLGAALAVTSYVCAFAGVLATHRQLNVAEQMSAAMYEAVQLLVLNMGVHDELNVPLAARWYFGFARALASALALFLAYKTVLYVSARAGARIHLNIDRLKVGRGTQLHLVIGLGRVGSQLTQNLANRGDRVIAIENNESNPCWKNPPEGKVRMLQADASLAETFAQLPFDAINNIFVTAGDDQRNIEIGQVVNEYSQGRVRKAELRDANKNWPNSLSRWLSETFMENRRSNCHVQLYDANMRRILDQALHGQEVAKTDVELRPFNAQEMAVRDLIQFELTDSQLRPKAENEVALYILVGFESLGQELALGIAQLAHFENLRRSRVLVLSRDPEEEIASFCARYPKFATDTQMGKLKDVLFDPVDDDWDAYTKSQLEDVRKCCGVDFAVNAKFAKLPPSASDSELLESIKRLTIEQLTTTEEILRVKPVVIVCDDEWQRGFAWASEFTDSWKQFCLRKKLHLAGDDAEVPPPIRTYFWLQGHNAIPRLLEKQNDLKPFGISNDLLTESAIAGTVWRQVGAVVYRSYELAVAHPKETVDKTTTLNS